MSLLPSRRPLLTILALGLIIGTLATTTVGLRAETPAEAMARAMARMMEAMGLFAEGGLGSGMPGLTDPSALAGFGTRPGSGGLGRMMEQAPEAMQRLLPGFAGTTLEGVWEGRDGGLLIVQGYRFRIQSVQGGYVDGLIQQRGERIAMYDPTSDSVRPYEYAEQDGRLVLRDPAGNVYLYRRLWLNQPNP